MAVLDSDGYFMAVSLAELLADRGKRVTLITLFDRVAPYTDFTLEGPNLRRMLREKGIACRVAKWIESAQAGATVALRLYDVYRDGFRRTDEPKSGEPPRRAGCETEDFRCDTRRAVHRPPFQYRSLARSRRPAVRLGRQGPPGRLPGRRLPGARATSPMRYSTAIAWGARSTAPIQQRPRAIIRERRIWGGEAWPKLGDPVL